MNNEMKFNGYFYLPGKEEHEIFGNLAFNPIDGIKLDVAGHLSGVLSGAIFKPDIILGKSLDGKKITLYKCFQYHNSLSFNGYIITKFTASFLFIGAHFNLIDEISFSKVFVQYNNLDEWLDISGFKIDNSKHLSEKEINICYKLPGQIKYKFNSEIELGFNFSHSSFQISSFQKKINLEQYSHLFLFFEKTQADLNKILDYIDRFQNFLALATLGITFPTKITLINPECYSEFQEEKQFEEINLYYKRGNVYNNTREIYNCEMLFTYDIIKNNFQKLFLNWMSISQDIKPTINLLFDYFYSPKTFTINNFLNIIHAIETYHRRSFNNYAVPPEQHKDRLKTIIDSVLPEYKVWLKEKLNFSHEPSLKERLEELINSVQNKDLLEILGSKEHLIKESKNSRNYFVHFDKKLKEKALNGKELYQLSEKLKFLLIYLLLKNVGLGEEIISKSFDENKYLFFGHIK